jgi:diguanylate cyclase (GGDEF)-like protein
VKSANALAKIDETQFDTRAHTTSEYISYYDPLTDLWNLHVFECRLTQELFRMRRYKHRPLSVVSVDVVGMTAINEIYGRDAGDQYLKGVACLLQTAVCESDMVARLGGDEFGILLTQTDTRVVVRLLNLIRSLANTADARWGFLPITLKLGSATTLDGNTTGRNLLCCAQVAQECRELG